MNENFRKINKRELFDEKLTFRKNNNFIIFNSRPHFSSTKNRRKSITMDQEKIN